MVKRFAVLAFLLALAACASGTHTMPPLGRSGAARALAQTEALSVSGTITYVNPNAYFTMKTTQCGYLHVYYTAQTVITKNGLTLEAGTAAAATGTGSCSTSLNASSITLGTGSPSPSPSPVATIPPHLLTADYMRDTQTVNDVIYPVSKYAPYLSFTDTTPNVANEFAAAGVQTMYYNDPNRVEPGYPMYTTDEAAYAHDCSGNRIHATNYPSLMLLDPSSPDTVALWKSSSELALSAGHFDYVFEDDVNDVYALNALPCGYSAGAWLTASKNEIAAMPFPVLYNDLNNVDANYDPPANLALNAVAPGGMMENCYVQTSAYAKAGGGYWLTTENVELTMAAQKKLFFCYSGNQTTASTATGIDLRTYMLASFLLTYDPSTSVLWERFWMPSNFRIQPESQFVALDPLVPEPASISALQDSAGAYERRYAHCYFQTRLIGGCAVAVNPSSWATVTDPLASAYHHTLALSGGGVLDAGTVSLAGAPPPAELPPKEAVVALP